LAREELLHYEQVMAIMTKRGIAYKYISNSRYAGSLRKHVRTYEPQHLIDILIIGAFVEARSCERFAAIAPYLDEELKRFYLFLLKSESRHFEYYLSLAQLYSSESIDERIAFFREKEAELILASDTHIRFHSGVPSQKKKHKNSDTLGKIRLINLVFCLLSSLKTTAYQVLSVFRLAMTVYRLVVNSQPMSQIHNSCGVVFYKIDVNKKQTNLF
jgi:hypothetical protein